MSKGHSQPRHQCGRRVLERCKAKESVEVIDVDKGEIDVVDIDEPETSHKGSKGSKATRSNCYPDGVISIDDDEGGSDDAPKNLHGSSKNKVFHPGSSDSSTSEESQSDECLMSTKKGSIPFRMRMCHSSISHFSLHSDSETSTSESDSSEMDTSQWSVSDSSDCVIMEDSSGNIREEWERAAHRKRMSENGHFGLEDQDSTSESSDDQLLSEEGIQNKINVENFNSKDPTATSAKKEKNDKESVFFGMPSAGECSDSHFKTKAKLSSGELDPSTDIHHKEASSHKNECSCERIIGKTQSMETFMQNKLAGVKRLEKLLYHPLCPPDVHLKFSFRDGDAFFLYKDMQVPVEVYLGTEGLHLEFYTDKAIVSGKISGTTKNFTLAVAELVDLCLEIEANSSTDIDPTSGIHHEESGFQKEEVIIETCRYKADEVFPDDKRAELQYIERQHTSCQKYRMTVNDADPSTSAAAEVSGSLLKSKGNTFVTETVSRTDIPGFEKKEHVSGACSCKAQSVHKSLPHEKGADFPNSEIRVGPSFCHSKVECNMDLNDGVNFLVKDSRIPTETSLATELYGGSGFWEEVEPCYGNTFSCSHQPCYAKQGPDNVGLQEQKEQVLGESSSISQSHCNSVVSPQTAGCQKPVYITSVCNHQPAEKSRVSAEYAEVIHGKSSCESHAGSVIGEQSHMPPVDGDLIWERESHKESDEYRQADEKEWAARQQQLQIQAEEVQRLKRKRKAESLRLLDIKRRQTERLEEIRESQKKGEENESLKERFRAEVRKELDWLELRFKDMASLLHGLGIPVAGGPYPSAREVNLAYRQALLKFHPDRASRTDIRQQVEAEEKFKLISRLKEKLQF